LGQHLGQKPSRLPPPNRVGARAQKLELCGTH
jgi:hypothetical protein